MPLNSHIIFDEKELNNIGVSLRKPKTKIDQTNQHDLKLRKRNSTVLSTGKLAGQ